jgi:hypothetical protein
MDEKIIRYIHNYRIAAGLEKPPRKRTNKDNHISEATREKNRQRERLRRQEHREEINARQRERYASDPEYRARKNALSHRWYLAHRDEQIAVQAKRRAENPEMYRERDKRYHENKKLREFSQLIAVSGEAKNDK